jgi:hypothetical protein
MRFQICVWYFQVSRQQRSSNDHHLHLSDFVVEVIKRPILIFSRTVWHEERVYKTAGIIGSDETRYGGSRSRVIDIFSRTCLESKLNPLASPGSSFSDMLPNRDTGSDACPFIEPPDICFPVALLHCLHHIASKPERSGICLLPPFECCENVNSRFSNALRFLAAVASFVVQQGFPQISRRWSPTCVPEDESEYRSCEAVALRRQRHFDAVRFDTNKSRYEATAE